MLKPLSLNFWPSTPWRAQEPHYVITCTFWAILFNLAALEFQTSDQEVESKKARVKLNQWVRLHELQRNSSHHAQNPAFNPGNLISPDSRSG